jgi:hypothetical protein
MKKVGMGLVNYVFMIAVVLFLIVFLSSCNMTGNVVLNGKDLIIEKMKGLHVPKSISLKTDTSKVEEVQFDSNGDKELTGDFRYDNLFK